MMRPFDRRISGSMICVRRAAPGRLPKYIYIFLININYISNTQPCYISHSGHRALTQQINVDRLAQHRKRHPLQFAQRNPRRTMHQRPDAPCAFRQMLRDVQRRLQHLALRRHVQLQHGQPTGALLLQLVRIVAAEAFGESGEHGEPNFVQFARQKPGQWRLAPCDQHHLARCRYLGDRIVRWDLFHTGGCIMRIIYPKLFTHLQIMVEKNGAHSGRGEPDEKRER